MSKTPYSYILSLLLGIGTYEIAEFSIVGTVINIGGGYNRRPPCVHFPLLIHTRLAPLAKHESPRDL